MCRRLVIRNGMSKVEAPGGVAFLGEVEKVRVGLLNGVARLQGLHMLLEFLPANRDAAPTA